MTITEVESGLSAADYTTIPDSTGSMSAQITLQRYGPVWADHPNDTDNGHVGENFDAVLVGQYLLRAYGVTVSEVSVDYMPSEVSGISDASWTNVDATAIDDTDEDTTFSLVAGTGLIARLFYINTGGIIKYSECTDITANAFGAPVTVCDPSGEVRHLAAVSTTRVHYIARTDQSNRRLHYAEHNGSSWSTIDSEVYWPFLTHSFDAVSLDASEDLLLLATDVAPLIGTRIVGTEVQTEINRVQALVTFKVKNCRWSDWQMWDAIDRVPSNYHRARNSARLSYQNDLLFATYTRAGGDGDYEYTRPAVMRSADGENWEFPELIPDADAPYVILSRDDYLYAVSISGTLRSLKCTWAGQDPTEYDATAYVLGMESQAAEIRNSNVSLANPSTSTTDVFEGALADDLPLSDDRLLLKYELGYWLSGNARKVHVSTEDIVQRGEQRGLPNLNLALTSQDYLGRMNRVRADYAAEWPGMQCGRDPFTDTTGTGYGGLRHMAPIKPSFKADDGVLELVSNNKEGIVVSTFVSDALCGSAQTSFDMVYDDKGERAFIAFRVFDKDNLYYCGYYPDSNVFKLYKRLGGEESADADYSDRLLATSSAIASWNTTRTDKHYMKVSVQYNKFILYRSDDGKSWTTVSWASPAGDFVELPGHLSIFRPVWSGRFGLGGYSYSDVDVPKPWTPPPWTPPYLLPYYYGVIVLNQSQLARSWDFFTVEDPSWEDIKGDITGTLHNIVLGADGRLFVTSSDGLWYTADVKDKTLTWTCIKSDTAAEADSGKAGSFGAVDVDENTVYAVWHCASTPGGYFSGTPGSPTYHSHSFYSPGWGAPLRSNYCIDATDGVIGCGLGQPTAAHIYTIGGGYTNFYGEWGFIICVKDGFCQAWDGTMYPGYSPVSPYDTNDSLFGIDVLDSTPLYYKAGGGELYRAKVKLADAASVFGKAVAGGRAIYTRDNVDEILWVVAGEAEPAPSAFPQTAFVWTSDAFSSFHDKTGDFFTAIGDWEGKGGIGVAAGDGNSLAIQFHYPIPPTPTQV